MNLSEMNKQKTMVSTDMTQLMPISHDTIDKWKRLLQEQAEALSKVTTERDELRSAQKKDREDIQKCLERMRELREKDQRISSENQKLQDELQKLTEENQKLQIELSRTQNISQSLQRSNDDLRNRNGLLSRKEQEKLEERIKDVQARNSKLQIQVNRSSVEAVDEAQRKQKEAEKKARRIEYQSNHAQEKVKTVMEKTDQEIKKLKNEVKEKEKFWMIVYIILILFAVIKNAIFQKDLFACITVPLQFLCRYVEGVICPSELNILGEREYFSAEWSWFLRVMAVFIFWGLYSGSVVKTKI